MQDIKVQNVLRRITTTLFLEIDPTMSPNGTIKNADPKKAINKLNVKTFVNIK
jgi:hypothetical protein